METTLIYIGKAAIAAAAFYLAFLLLFQNQKHFRFNRIYLPVSLAISFVIPLVTFTTVRYIETVPTSMSNSFAYLPDSRIAIDEPQFMFEWFHYLFGIYILGSCIFLFYLILGHFKAIRIVQKSRTQKLFDALINVTIKDVHPFSFFSKIVISENTLDHPNLKMIVEHENVHVKEKHTLDILFAEILFLFQWFNPFVWLIKDAMKNNLEYLTDHQITQNNNAKDYQLAMVTLADKKGVAPFLTALNGNQLKNRIIMMKKKKENKYSILKQSIVLPLLAILVMGLSNKEVKTETVKTSKTVEIVLDGKVLPADHPNLKSYDFSEDFDGKEVIEALHIEDKVVSNTLFIGEDPAKLTYYVRTSDYVLGTNAEFEKNTSELNISTSIEEKESLYAIDNNLVEKADFEKASVNGFETLTILSDKDVIQKYGESASGVVIDATTGVSNFKITDKSENNNGNENIELLVDRIEISEEKKNVEEYSGYGVYESQDTTGSGYVISGDMHGKVKVGSDDMIITPSTNKGIRIKASGDKAKQPLFVVDGKVIDSNEDISPEVVESITVLKDESATAVYGEKGKNGVILIQTKNNNKVETSDIITIRNTTTENTDSVFLIVDEMPEFPGGKTALKKYISNATKYPEIAKENGIQGKVYVTFIVDTNGDVNNPMIAKGVDPSLDKEALRVVHSLPNWKPGKQNGKSVNVSYTVPITFGSPEKIEIPKGMEPLFVVDGIEKDNIEYLGTEEIESISVLKDESATSIFGKKGKNGVVIVTTKGAEVISSELDLRKFIAKRVKYPVSVQEKNIRGKIKVYAEVNSMGIVTSVSEKQANEFEILGEVVITSYAPKNNSEEKIDNQSEALTLEAKRVVQILPKIDIPEFKGKTVEFTFNFTLQ